MSVVNLDDIKKRYNFQTISIATWRDPNASVLPFRGGPSPVSISPDAVARPFVPKYKVRYPDPLPEPTDDEASDDEQDEDIVPVSDNGATSAPDPDEVVAVSDEVEPELKLDDEPIGADPPASGEPAEELVAEDTAVSPYLTESVDGESIPEDSHKDEEPLPASPETSEESKSSMSTEATTMKDDAPTDAPEDAAVERNDDEISEHGTEPVATEPAGPDSASEEAVPEAEPVATHNEEDDPTETSAQDATDVPDVVEHDIPESASEAGAVDQGTPATDESPPSAAAEEVEEAGDPDEIVQIIDESLPEEEQAEDVPPRAPTPPLPSDETFDDHAESIEHDVASLAGSYSDHSKKEVTFAPGIPSPKPTVRKKKGSKGGKNKSKKRFPVQIDSLPPDILALTEPIPPLPQSGTDEGGGEQSLQEVREAAIEEPVVADEPVCEEPPPPPPVEPTKESKKSKKDTGLRGFVKERKEKSKKKGSKKKVAAPEPAPVEPEVSEVPPAEDDVVKASGAEPVTDVVADELPKEEEPSAAEDADVVEEGGNNADQILPNGAERDEFEGKDATGAEEEVTEEPVADEEDGQEEGHDVVPAADKEEHSGTLDRVDSGFDQPEEEAAAVDAPSDDGDEMPEVEIVHEDENQSTISSSSSDSGERGEEMPGAFPLDEAGEQDEASRETADEIQDAGAMEEDEPIAKVTAVEDANDASGDPVDAPGKAAAAVKEKDVIEDTEKPTAADDDEECIPAERVDTLATGEDSTEDKTEETASNEDVAEAGGSDHDEDVDECRDPQDLEAVEEAPEVAVEEGDEDEKDVEDKTKEDIAVACEMHEEDDAEDEERSELEGNLRANVDDDGNTEEKGTVEDENKVDKETLREEEENAEKEQQVEEEGKREVEEEHEAEEDIEAEDKPAADIGPEQIETGDQVNEPEATEESVKDSQEATGSAEKEDIVEAVADAEEEGPTTGEEIVAEDPHDGGDNIEPPKTKTEEAANDGQDPTPASVEGIAEAATVAAVATAVEVLGGVQEPQNGAEVDEDAVVEAQQEDAPAELGEDEPEEAPTEQQATPETHEHEEIDPAPEPAVDEDAVIVESTTEGGSEVLAVEPEPTVSTNDVAPEEPEAAPEPATGTPEGTAEDAVTMNDKPADEPVLVPAPPPEDPPSPKSPRPSSHKHSSERSHRRSRKHGSSSSKSQDKTKELRIERHRSSTNRSVGSASSIKESYMVLPRRLSSTTRPKIYLTAQEAAEIAARERQRKLEEERLLAYEDERRRIRREARRAARLEAEEAEKKRQKEREEAEKSRQSARRHRESRSDGPEKSESRSSGRKRADSHQQHSERSHRSRRSGDDPEETSHRKRRESDRGKESGSSRGDGKKSEKTKKSGGFLSSLFGRRK